MAGADWWVGGQRPSVLARGQKKRAAARHFSLVRPFGRCVALTESEESEVLCVSIEGNLIVFTVFVHG